MLLAIALSSMAPASPTALPEITPEVRAIAAELQQKSSVDAMPRLEKLAEADHSALVLLGEIYFLGLFDIPPDQVKACSYFEPLKNTYGEVAHNFATCYFNAVGKRTDKAIARQYYRKATELGWPDSTCALGNMLIAGTGGEKDVVGGLELCRAAAEAGVAHAQADYGTYLLLGKIMPKDAVAARVWLAKAAEQKHANASFLLGQIYWKGDGIAEDRNIAAKWLKAAYENGRPDAAFLLAQEAMARSLIKSGETVVISPEVLPEAIHWLEITQKVDGRPEEKARNAELLEMLYEMKEKKSLNP